MNPELVVGCTVNLLKDGKLVADNEGYPYIYQVIIIHKRSGEVSLINPLGEYVGRFHSDQVIYFNSDSLFSSGDYYLGQRVSWVDNDSVYEGRIKKLMTKAVEVEDVKLLMPVDYVKRLPYYKLYGDPNN